MEVLLPQLNILTPTLSSTPAMPATIKNHKLYEVSVSGREQSSLSPKPLKEENRSQNTKRKDLQCCFGV